MWPLLLHSHAINEIASCITLLQHNAEKGATLGSDCGGVIREHLYVLCSTCHHVSTRNSDMDSSWYLICQQPSRGTHVKYCVCVSITEMKVLWSYPKRKSVYLDKAGAWCTLIWYWAPAENVHLSLNNLLMPRWILAAPWRMRNADDMQEEWAGPAWQASISLPGKRDR